MEETLKGLNIELPYLEMGSGFMIGLSVGYFLKKSFKFVLLLGGLIIVVLFILENKGVVTIDQVSLDKTVTTFIAYMKEFVGFVKGRLGEFSFAGGSSTLAGFLFGLKWG